MTKWQWQNDLDKLYITGLWWCKNCNEKLYIEIVSGKPFVIVILTSLTSGMLREGLGKVCEGLRRFGEDLGKIWGRFPEVEWNSNRFYVRSNDANEAYEWYEWYKRYKRYTKYTKNDKMTMTKWFR